MSEAQLSNLVYSTIAQDVYANRKKFDSVNLIVISETPKLRPNDRGA